MAGSVSFAFGRAGIMDLIPRIALTDPSEQG